MKKKREPNSGSFVKGEGGRPKGARNKFSVAVVEEFAADWSVNGKQAIEDMRINKPDVYVRTAVSLVPKDLDVQHSGNLNVYVVAYTDDDDDE